MKSVGICLLFLGASLGTASARAELVDLGMVTRDTVSGLEWLDLSQTSGRSFGEVVTQFASGGHYGGYRHATSGEAQGVFLQLGLPVVPYTSYLSPGGLVAALANFDRLLGLNVAGLGSAYGFSAQVGDAIAGYAGYHAAYYGFPSSLNTDLPPGEIAGAFGDRLVSTREVTVGYATSFKSATTGHFLVRQVAAIPEPQTVALMLAGLLLTSLVARRRRH